MKYQLPIYQIEHSKALVMEIKKRKESTQIIQQKKKKKSTQIWTIQFISKDHNHMGYDCYECS